MGPNQDCKQEKASAHISLDADCTVKFRDWREKNLKRNHGFARILTDHLEIVVEAHAPKLRTTPEIEQ